MKLISYLFLVLCSIIFMTLPKTNPLSNTSWNGILYAPDPIDSNLKFSNDTMYVYIQSQLIEKSTYTVTSDTLKISKVSGNSPCADEIGVYLFNVNNDVLNITPVLDICDVRYYAFSVLGYKKE